MMLSGSLKGVEMAAVAGCSDRSIHHIRSNLRCYGTTKASANGVGRPRQITPLMLEALREHLLEEPGTYQDEMTVFLYHEFGIFVTISSISRALASIG
jgi:transposase